MNTRRLIRPILNVLLFAIASSACAQDADERARAHFAAGQSHVEQHRYAEAHTEFALGFALSDRALFLFNMAECSLLAGDARAAEEEYTRYLSEAPEGSRAADARERLRELGANVPVPEEVPESGTEEESDVPAARVEPESSQGGPEISPEHVASASLDASANSVSDEVPLRRNWKFWTVVGSSVAAVVIGVAVGVALSSGSGGPQCSGACVGWDISGS